MKRRNWDSRTKAKVVLERLTGKPVSEICNRHQISQNQYYQWRDKFLAEAHRAFEVKENAGEVARLKAKAQKL
jgi:transposase-like protein